MANFSFADWQKFQTCVGRLCTESVKRSLKLKDATDKPSSFRLPEAFRWARLSSHTRNPVIAYVHNTSTNQLRGGLMLDSTSRVDIPALIVHSFICFLLTRSTTTANRFTSNLGKNTNRFLLKGLSLNRLAKAGRPTPQGSSFSCYLVL